MASRHYKLGFAICMVVLVALALMALKGAYAQGPTEADPVGTWNVTGTIGGTPSFIAVENFNKGGTFVEFCTAATGNPNANQSITLGNWQNTGAHTFTFKQQNYTFDSIAGNLNGIAIANTTATLSQDGNSFTGSGQVNFFTCTVTQCPGTLVFGPLAFTVSGTRF